MAKIFYDHLVVIEEVEVKLEKYDMDALSRQELTMLIDETLHHELINLILTHLPENLHENFLTKFYENPGDASLLDYIKLHSGKDMERLIRQEAKKVKKEIIEEIKKSRNK